MAFINESVGSKRFSCANGGQALAASDFSLSAGFGSTASVAVAAGGNDARFKITVTSAGTGQAVNPTCTLTFKDGAWMTPNGTDTMAPVVVTTRAGGSQATVQFQATSTTTTAVLTFMGTAAAGETYSVMVQALG